MRQFDMVCNGLPKAITKALAERMLEGDLTHHLGYEKKQSLPLESMSAVVENRAVYVAICIKEKRTKEVLGRWSSPTAAVCATPAWRKPSSRSFLDRRGSSDKPAEGH